MDWRSARPDSIKKCFASDMTRTEKLNILLQTPDFRFGLIPIFFFLSLNLVGKSNDAATETRLSCRFEVEGVTRYEGLYLDY